MLHMEDEKTEYKQEVTESIKKEVIAFANTAGGSVYIGIMDDGSVLGVDNRDEVLLSVGNMLRDAVCPDVMMFVQLRAEVIEQKDVVHIVVLEGTNKPYYLRKNGLKPSGVYVRQGSASVQASAEQIRQMIKASDGEVFENNVSLNQELTFQKTGELFRRQGMNFGEQQLVTLGLRRPDGIYTNAGLLLSDQCPFTLKAAVFRGEDQNEFQDRKEFRGPILSQLEECYTYLQLNNTLSAKFQGLYRKDEKAYPVEAIRESLLNCMVHRDYSFSASSLISIYSNRMEFTSIGGLMPGIHKDDIMLGISVCRNKKLADVFYRLELIEAYGTGMLKIRNAYKAVRVKPEILIATNSFKIILPRIQEETISLTGEENDEKERILAYLGENEEMTRKDAEDLLGASSSSVTRLLNRLIEGKVVARIGRGKGTRYTLTE